MKLNAYVSHAGVCSRRKAVVLIKEGAVTVNGHVAVDPAYDVKDNDKIMVQGKRIKAEQKIYIMLNKPKGYVTTASDELGRQTVLDLLGDAVKERLYPIGRLDRDTTGLLLLTNDGDLAHKLAHPSYEIAKSYQVTLDKDLTEDSVSRIKRGVYLEDGKARVDELSFCSPRTRLAFRVVLHSGKKRIIRRLFEALGYTVKILERVVYAGIPLKGLAKGQWRYLSKAEVKHLQNAVQVTKSSRIKSVRVRRPAQKTSNSL
jgi:23S rRNA pseudouridine2605 synthase